MKKSNNKPANRQEIKEENDFLKMKMMLEYGAEFGSAKDIPPEIENEFLKSVAAFEENHKIAGTIKVFDKIGNPQQFKPVASITDDNIESDWISLHEYLKEHGIDLNVFSPNVSARELYRFTTEELFELETENISIPGMMNFYIYDEFYPDHKYENERTAKEDCINYFFEKEYFFDYHFSNIIQLNNRNGLSKKQVAEIIYLFKASYDEIRNIRIESNSCTVDADVSVVSGFYEAIFTVAEKHEFKTGNWSVEFSLNSNLEYWYINKITIEGLGL